MYGPAQEFIIETVLIIELFFNFKSNMNNFQLQMD